MRVSPEETGLKYRLNMAIDDVNGNTFFVLEEVSQHGFKAFRRETFKYVVLS